MFFTDDDGAKGVLFGGSKVVVANFEMGDAKGMMAGVLFGEGAKNKIVTIGNNEGKDSRQIRAKIRLVFEDLESVDVVLGALQRVKEALFKSESDKVLQSGDALLKPEEN